MRGVGIKTAIKYLNGELNGKSKVVRRIEDSGEEIAFYEGLVKLPMYGTRRFELGEDKLSEDKFWNVFDQYGFHSFMKQENWSDWVDFIDEVPF